MAEADGSTKSRNPRQIAEETNGGQGDNRFEPTPETIPGNPEPRRQEHRHFPLPQAQLPKPET